MASATKNPPGNPTSRRWTSFTGLFFDEFASDSAWIRDTGRVHLPPLPGIKKLLIQGEYRPDLSAIGMERDIPALVCHVRGGASRTISPERACEWETLLDLPAAAALHGAEIVLKLHGVGLTNLLAWLGRVTGLGVWQRFRRQRINRQLRVTRIATADGEVIYDFAQRQAPYSVAFARRHMHLGLNVVGFLTADLGVGESARCMVRSADAGNLPVALVPLKLNCKNRLGDLTYASRLQDENPHDVNVFHLDPPSSCDIDHHHGKKFRAGKHNIAYWAWELPEFPDAWMANFDLFDEVWCPSEFTRDAIAMKSSVPVLVMPHSISFARPTESTAALRQKFNLPAESFLFLFVYDLNSYSERKNPRAVIDAFRASHLAGSGAALVVKVQNVAGNEADFASLRSVLDELPGSVLISGTLSRAEIYQLEASCDCFVSLHRAEGFGLAVAECMYLGKPVIATNWSATAEFLNATNGCPVDCKIVTLEVNHGPYMKGSSWAEPSVGHAASWMKRLFSDRNLASQIGAAARATIEQRFDPARIGARYRQRLEAIAWY